MVLLVTEGPKDIKRGYFRAHTLGIFSPKFLVVVGFTKLPQPLIAATEVVVSLTTGWTTGVRYPTGAEDFSSSLCVQTGSGAHPASCTMNTEGPFPGGKAQPGRDADHTPPSSAEVKYE
jgi:hypothetical protein